MNYGVVIKVLGNLLLYKAIALILPLIIAAIDKGTDLSAFIYSIIIVLAVGIPMSKFPKKSNKIKSKDALTIVILGWVLTSTFGSLPFILSGSIPSFIDAFFETVSGLTTTGATIIDDIEALPRGILFWRSFTHWLGGMGILVLTIAILPTIGVGGFQIFKAESPGPISDKLVPRVKDTAKILYTAYFGITVLQVILLYLGGMSLYESLIHTFGTVGTGGFSTRNASIGAFDSSYITMIIAIFMVGSGVNFALYYELYKGRWGRIIQNTEFKLYIGIVSVSVILLTINMYGNVYTSIFETFKHSLFQVASITTTTGYATANYEEWTDFSKAILFCLMFVGGSAGSTSGSIKVIRFLIMIKLIKRETLKLLHPKAYIPVSLNDKIISSDVVASVISFFFLYFLVLAMGTIVISLEDIGLKSSITAVAATLGNIGPGLGFVGPTQTYSQFTDASKFFLSLLMLFGRLELFTMIILFVPGFWKD